MENGREYRLETLRDRGIALFARLSEVKGRGNCVGEGPVMLRVVKDGGFSRTVLVVRYRVRFGDGGWSAVMEATEEL